MRTLFLFCVALAAANANAAESMFGTTDAMACYEAATFQSHASDAALCSSAIKAGKLSRPQLAATYSNRGIILARANQLDKAIDDQNMALEIDASLARVYINRANAYYRAGRHEEALADYDKAVALSQANFAPAYYNRAIVHRKLGHQEAALHDLQQATTLEPQNAIYQAALVDLQ